MTDYLIYRTDGSGPITVPANSLTTIGGLNLVGQGSVNYGATIATDQLHSLENFANTSAPGTPQTGQLWYNKTSSKLLVNTGTPGSPNWVGAGAGTTQSSAPSTPSSGDLWYDTVNHLLKVWSGSSWDTVGPSSGAPGVSSFTTGGFTLIEIVVNGVSIGVWSNVTITGPTSELTARGFTGTPQVVPGLNIPDAAVGDSGATRPVHEGSLRLAPNGTASAPTLKFIGDDNSGIFHPSSGITAISSNGNEMIRVNTTGGLLTGAWVLAGGATLQATYSDLAERFHADEYLTPGTLVKIGGSAEITKTSIEEDTDVFGVVATAPAFKMNATAGSDETHPYIALSGQIPVSVIGKVAKGQRLTSSILAGIAKGATRDTPYTAVFGRALESKDTDGLGYVKAVVGAK